ncbi:MAG: hypothetical protein RLZZ196_1027 [Bacteroidota bacterium]|jgi:hypothetical protein
MGLDMYLRGKRFFSSYFDEKDTELQRSIAKLFPELENRSGIFSDESPIQELTINVGYWRKANAIHNWFVTNVQNSHDDCGYYHVSRDKLHELRDTCQQVLANTGIASNLLPTVSGFFFGGTSYDEMYEADLQYTIQMIDECLVLPKQWEFEYHSSW